MRIKLTTLIFLFLLTGILTKPVFAHPGRTAADGCHYCRTNCESYGVPYNERHCHGGSTPASNSTQSTQQGNSQSAPVAPIFQQPAIEKSKIPLPTNIPTKAPYMETEQDKLKQFKVISIVDGDTIKVNIRGNVESVRLLGIDTPETVDPRKPVQCFGKAASDKMKALVSGKFVKLIDDKSQGSRDKYKRLLRYVYLQDGTFVNSEMVKQGFATSYKQYPTKYLTTFNKLEKQAREKNLGLWGACK